MKLLEAIFEGTLWNSRFVIILNPAINLVNMM